jgi:hypothetical protein
MKYSALAMAAALAALSACSGSTTPPPQPPVIVVTPGTQVYPNTQVNVISAPIPFSVKNIGGSPTNIFIDGLGGTNASEFTITADACAFAGTLAPGDTCTISVVFAPVGAAGGRAATLDVMAQPGGSTFHVMLSGTALP